MIVSALLAIRRLAREVDWLSSLDVAMDLLVVPSVMPKPYRKPDPRLVLVLPLVQKMMAFGAEPTPCATACVTGAADVDFVKLPTVKVPEALAGNGAPRPTTAISAITPRCRPLSVIPFRISKRFPSQTEAFVLLLGADYRSRALPGNGTSDTLRMGNVPVWLQVGGRLHCGISTLVRFWCGRPVRDRA